MTQNPIVRITSWNIAGTEPLPGPMLDQLFDDSSRLPNIKPDFQIVGLQEAPFSLLHDAWTEELSSSLHKRGYILFKKHNLSGILLYIFVLGDIIMRCRDFETESVKTYLLKSKGGVSLRFDYNGNSLCFTNAHFQAHQENIQDRINDYKTILEGTTFHINPSTPGIMDHDYAVWFGDLNFRFDNITTNQVLSIIQDYVLSGSKNNALEKLYKHDQLIMVRDKNLAFVNWTETLPKFLPTYKYKKGSRDDYDSAERIPAWTDRVLYRTNQNKNNNRAAKSNPLKMEQLFYGCLQDFDISDHKPIISIFKFTTNDPEQLLKDKSRLPYEVIKFEPIVGWRAGRDGRLWYKISDELFLRQPAVLSSWDRVALYKSDFSSLDQYLTFVYPPAIARIAPRLDATRIPYQRSPSSSRGSSPAGSRRNSSSSITQATEAMTLNESIATTGRSVSPAGGQQNVNRTTSGGPISPGPIVEDGYKYFSVQFPDELLVPGSYKALYLKITEANEYNVYGISAPFVITS